jgi:hypothetical protein
MLGAFNILDYCWKYAFCPSVGPTQKQPRMQSDTELNGPVLIHDPSSLVVDSAEEKISLQISY